MFNYKNLIVIGIILIAFVLGGVFMINWAERHGKTLSVDKIIVPEDGLTFVTPGGKAIGRFFSDKYGGGLVIYNNQEVAIGVIVARENSGFIGIKSNEEKILWKAP